MKIRIIIADDHKIFSQGLKSILESDNSIEIVSLAENGKEAIDYAKKIEADIILMDISMPVVDGIKATRRIKRSRPGLKVMALSMHAEKQYIKRMLKAGIDAYLLKNSSSQTLLHAVHSVYHNKKYLSENINDLIRNYNVSNEVLALVE